MNKFASIVTALLLMPLAAQAQNAVSYDAIPAGNYASDPNHTSVTFKLSHFGLSNYTARFAKADAQLAYNPKAPTTSKLVATVDPTSIKTDYKVDKEHDFDKELQGEKWFNSAKFPTIKFESTKIELTDKTHGKIYGNLTMLGVTKPIVFDAVYNGGYAVHPFTKKSVMGFSLTGKLKRSDWGLSSFVPMVGDEVELIIETEFDK